MGKTSRSRVKIDIENLDEILKKLEPSLISNPMAEMYKDLGDRTRKSLEQTTQAMAHRTGNLAGSFEPFKLWKYEGQLPTGGMIENKVFYGRFVDLGTQTIRPRRFLRKTATKSRPAAESALRGMVRKVESRWRT